jgi:MFS family permease
LPHRNDGLPRYELNRGGGRWREDCDSLSVVPSAIMKVIARRAGGEMAANEATVARAEASRPPRFAALQSRNFRLLWFGLLISNAGTWMESTGQGWLVTDLEPERKAFWIGMIAACFAVPMLVLPPVGGAVADRVSRLRLLWSVQVTYLVASAVLTVLTLTHVVNVWHLLVYSFINGTVLAFDSPARHALLPDLVAREHLTSAVSLNSVSFTGASLIGPAIAGALIPAIGVGGVFTVNTLSCCATLWALWQLRGLPQRTHQPSPVNAFRSITQGVAFVLGQPLLRGLLAVSIATGIFARSYSVLLVVLARDEFHVGSGAFGLLVSAGGLGTLIGGFGLAGRGDVARRGRWILGATLTQAVLLLGIAATPWYTLALPLVVMTGLASAVGGALIATLIQLAAPNELRGRIMSLYILTLIGVPSSGAFLYGAVGEVVGVRAALGGGAVVLAIAAATIAARNRAVGAAA